MSFDEPNARDVLRLTPRHYFWIAALFLGVVLAAAIANRVLNGNAASTQAAVTAMPMVGASAPTALEGPQWADLTGAQKVILQPLASTWNALGYSQKNKWIALASNYPNRSPESQAKLQSRMAEWAALTPQDRERARLNYAATKKLSASERAAEWAAYQELSDEEKQKLADKRKIKLKGAAIAVAPVASDKLTAVPVTRRTARLQDASPVVKAQIDPNTLLPKPVAPAVSAPANVVIDVAPAPAADTSYPRINIDTLSPN